MAPKKAPGAGKRKVLRTTVEFKKALIAKYESGARITELSKEYGMAKSTICTILKKKAALKASDVAKGASVLSKQRPQILEEIEKSLFNFITERQLAGDTVREEGICVKARDLFSDLTVRDPSLVPEGFEFKASRGWFDKFRRRSGIHSVVRHGATASPHQIAATKFKIEFDRFVRAGGYLPRQVFNCGETGLFWKKMPRWTHITQEETSLPGHKPMKDRFTLLLCGNASGDCKIKPLLVYHSENPRAFKQNNVMKSTLPVMWRSNTKALLTRQFCTEWVHDVFAPSVKAYLEEKNLPVRCLLIMDNTPAYPPGLEDTFDFIKVKFLPLNTAPLIQPMDQLVIGNFKKLYTKFLFQRCSDVTSDTKLTLLDFWKHFNIYHGVALADKAWRQLTDKTMNCAWRKLWPECVPVHSTASGNMWSSEDNQLLDEIVTLGHSLGLVMDRGDVENLLEEHRDELTPEELRLLQEEQKKTLEDEELSSDEGEGKADVPSADIKAVCAKWNEIHNFVEFHHPNKAECSRALQHFNDRVMSHFRKVLTRRQKQVTMDRFFKKR